MRIPGQTEWFGWLLALLEIMSVLSVTLVLGGNAYISTACSLIDEDAEQWRIVMRDQTPEATAGEAYPSIPPPPWDLPEL